MNERQGFLILLVLLFGTIAAMMLRQFAPYIFGAMILGFVLRGLQFRLRDVIGERKSAFLLTILSIVLAVLPLILAGAAVAEDAQDLVRSINSTQALDLGGLERQIEQITGQEIDIDASLSSALRKFSSEVLGGFSQVVSLFTNFVVGISVMLFLTYYFLKDGEELIEWMKQVSPLPRDIEDELFRKMELTTSAVMKGHILVSVAQGLIAGIGLAVFGVPNYVFWTFLMVILGVIPLVGSSLIWAPASIYLVFGGQPVQGLMLAVYGTIVVGATDNLLRPYVVDQEADLHPALIIFGVLGGMAVFGITGLFLGPIAFGALKSILSVYRQNYREL
ncbi:MAG: AI-2E family transporter [Candidatus Nanosalina sp.]